MTTTHDQDRDDAALRALLAEPHVDDAGFTERLTSALPARSPTRQRRTKRNIAILGGALAAGTVGAVVVAGGIDFGKLGALPLGSVLPLAVVVAVAVWGLVEGARADAR